AVGLEDGDHRPVDQATTEDRGHHIVVAVELTEQRNHGLGQSFAVDPLTKTLAGLLSHRQYLRYMYDEIKGATLCRRAKGAAIRSRIGHQGSSPDACRARTRYNCRLFRHATFESPVSVLRLPTLPSAAGKQHWGNLPGAALSLAIAEAASAADTRFTLLLTPDSLSAERLKEDLAFFAPTLPVLHFPDWETLPYDQFSPHQDIISQRIATLYRLPEVRHGVLVVPINTALHRLA